MDTREEAQRYCDIYTERYDGKPYPNGLGFYKCTNFRVVEININVPAIVYKAFYEWFKDETGELVAVSLYMMETPRVGYLVKDWVSVDGR